jgi:hypothetical protein
MTSNFKLFPSVLNPAPLCIAMSLVILVGCGSSSKGSSGSPPSLNSNTSLTASAGSGSGSVQTLGIAAGSYSGLLVSHSTGETLGTLQVTLQEATTQGGQPKSSVLFKSFGDKDSESFSTEFSFDSLNYNAHTQELSGTRTFKVASQEFEINFLSLFSSSGSLSGTLKAGNFPNWGADFNLQRSSPLQTTPAPSSGTSGQISGQTSGQTSTFPDHFSGTIFDNEGATQSAQSASLSLKKASMSSEQKFFELLSPLEVLDGTLTLGNGATLPLLGAVWDKTRGTLELEPVLKCQFISTADPMNCTGQFFGTSAGQNSSQTSGAPDTLILTADAAPAPAAVSLVPRLKTTGQKWTYSGSAQFEDSKGKKISRAVTLEVSLLASASTTDVQNQNLQLTFLVQPAKVGVQFDKAVWNTNSQALEATQVLTVGANSGQVNFACESFSLQKTAYNFECRYASTLSNVQADIHFSHK